MVRFRRELILPYTLRWVVIVIGTYSIIFHFYRQVVFGDNLLQFSVALSTSVVFIYLVFTTRAFVEIDVKENQFFEFVSVLGAKIKIGEKVQLNGIEKIFFNSMRYTKNTGPNQNGWVTLGFWPTFSGSVYVVYLKDVSGKKYFLFEEGDKEKLLKRLLNANKVLNTQIFDNTSGVAELVQSSN